MPLQFRKDYSGLLFRVFISNIKSKDYWSANILIRLIITIEWGTKKRKQCMTRYYNDVDAMVFILQICREWRFLKKGDRLAQPLAL
jgi:hypothetical protein